MPGNTKQEKKGVTELQMLELAACDGSLTAEGYRVRIV